MNLGRIIEIDPAVGRYIVGPEWEFVFDYRLWAERRKNGQVKVTFGQWRKNRTGSYWHEYGRLKKEQGG